MFARLLMIGSLFLAAAAYLGGSTARMDAVAPSHPLADFPWTIRGWTGEPAPAFDPEVLARLGTGEYVNRIYRDKQGSEIGLYAGYYRTRGEGETIHSPLNCLPGAGWEPVRLDRVALRLPARSPAPGGEGGSDLVAEVNRYEIQKGADRQLVLYWYQSHGRVVASEYWDKWYTIVDALRLNRTDGAMVRLMTPIADSAPSAHEADQLLRAFVAALFPALTQFLPR